MTVDAWVAKKIGLPDGAALTREALEGWQLARLREMVAYARERSAFYAERLAGCGRLQAAPTGTDDGTAACLREALATLPFTTADDLVREGARMVCVPASQVDRIVTLPTSGTTGAPKRVWFTAADQELMVDYIHHGLPVMTGPGDVFLILMPCERPESVGDLVAKGVERIGSRAVRVGAIPPDGSRDEEVLDIMRREGVTTGLATAPTAARLARRSAGGGSVGGGRLQAAPTGMDACAGDAGGEIARNMRTILLSAQFIADDDREAIERIWGCVTYEHYGMTEMGLGGAMACAAHVGYHPREADLLFEIVDPVTGAPVPEGEYGEIVFTTLTRRAMPLIRYRTGDRSRFLPGPCPCGSALKRLDKVGDRDERKGY